jgi:hypothetical protein
MVEIMRKAGKNVKIKTEQHNPAALGRTGYSPAGPKPLVRVPRSRKTTDRSRRECSSVRVHHHRFGKLTAGRLGVIVGEWVIDAGLDDPFHNLDRRPRGGTHPHPLFP